MHYTWTVQHSCMTFWLTVWLMVWRFSMSIDSLFLCVIFVAQQLSWYLLPIIYPQLDLITVWIFVINALFIHRVRYKAEMLAVKPRLINNTLRNLAHWNTSAEKSGVPKMLHVPIKVCHRFRYPLTSKPELPKGSPSQSFRDNEST